MTSATIRRARPGDEHDILRLIRALADYENEPDAVKATAGGLADKLFGADPRVFAHVAERDGRVVGMAVWFFTFSTWTGRHGLFLEDLFVDPEARGSGIARALLEALGEEAKANDCARIDWWVLGWNELAKGLYRKLGGRHMDEWEPWRIDGDALEALQGD
ncbi:GNAT family N-acetyltransferase [Rhizorhabdus dicambivorans]|uniref:N-acetyltransferase n=1 Tax=Rhizorhabdus dicambivorans TaxID=1850238 RepID=A0A2A4FWM8_9SPHN|nr:GNAT family N-acetyltransferase [Rhizorhabdus dicambivorans]ATE63724.1 N-acetyltransferase [Rhizorhabdus dicambivorans]PCE42854.1 N-acetyltransferase [Rhizorhabdus dicambivorans]